MGRNRNMSNTPEVPTGPITDEERQKMAEFHAENSTVAPPPLTMPADAAAASGATKGVKLSPRERFVKYRLKRLQRVEKALHSVAQFGNKNAYAMTPQERERVLAWLERCYVGCVNRIAGTAPKDAPLDPFAGLES